MSSESIINKMRKNNERNYTDEELKSLPKSILHAMAVWNGSASKLNADLEALRLKKQFTIADCCAAAKFEQAAEFRSSAAVKTATFVQTHGGSFQYTPETCTIINTAGVKKEFPNVPLPLPADRKPNYDNIQQVAALCCHLVKNDKGTWRSGINTESWVKVYKTLINPTGMQQVAASVCTILNDSSEWKLKDAIAKNSVQGLELLSFVISTLNSLPADAYYYLNNQIVFYGYHLFERAGTDWVQYDEETFPETIKICDRLTKKEERGLSDQLDEFPALFKYRGGVLPKVSFYLHDGSFHNALQSLGRLREIQGSDNGCASLLASMRDYSGLSDEFGRRISFLISCVLTAWSLKKRAVVVLYTVGDLCILVSSLNHWKKNITECGGTVFDKKKTYECDTRFKLSDSSDKRNVPSTLHHLLVSDLADGDLVINYDPGQLPTSYKKKEKPDYEAYSRTLIPEYIRQTHDYIVYSTIFGDNPFQIDPRTTRIRDDQKPVHKDIYVYKFGVSSAFRGVMSSLSTLSLTGYGPKPLEKGYARDEVVLHALPLKQYLSQAEWYDLVMTSCEAQSVVPFGIVSRYSGISNLISQSKTAAALQLRSVALDGKLSAPVEVARATAGKQVINFSKLPTTDDRAQGKSVVADDDENDDDDGPPLTTASKKKLAFSTSKNNNKAKKAN